jgi:lipopolysaccharide/colanic/teichoic acid biosynthesis glycosyltransferase
MKETAEARLQAEVIANRGRIPWRRKGLERGLKRLFDIVAAAGLLFVLSPLLLMTAFLVRVTSPGPVLLTQIRVGLDGVPLRMKKFRSMVADNLDGFATGSGEVTFSDPRLTPIGGFIRAWRLDELPQLFHVLTGTMSLVGPRPDIPSNLPLYTPEQMIRFTMPPGCTAWTFTRGAFDNDWAERQNINVEYAWQWSLWLDMKILVGSLVVLLAQKSTTPESSAMRSREETAGVGQKQ